MGKMLKSTTACFTFCSYLILATALLYGAAYAQWTYPGCDDVTNDDFEVTPVVTRATDPSLYEPVKMAFDMRADGFMDIYYIQRHDGGKKDGMVKRYDGKSKTVSTLGTIPVTIDWEDGLVGIAMDPDFAANNRIYLYYGYPSGARISRFTLKGEDKKLDPASEKVVLSFPTTRRRWHTGGAMQFDAYGDLWITVGDYKTPCKGTANTADHRGGILRIHPEEDGTYSIPKGNMWEAAEAYFRNKGMDDVAEKYLDSTKMKRETYAMGMRNPYSLTLDPVRRWATFGDCGPDTEPKRTSDKSRWTEEHTVVTEPSFTGWPFWSADQHFTKKIPHGGACQTGSMSTDSPINKAGAIPELMPAIPATHPYAHDCATTGPIFRYDGRISGTDQIPPHFNRVWFVTDFNNSQIHAIKLDDKGKMVGEAVQMFKGLSNKLRKPLDFQQGPDGALYYLSYTCGGWRTVDGCSGIYRISYKGTCYDPELTPEPVPGTAGPSNSPTLTRALDYDIQANVFVVFGAGTHRLEAFSLDGRSVFRVENQGPHRYPAGQVFQSRQPGLYQVRLSTSKGGAIWIHPHLNASGR